MNIETFSPAMALAYAFILLWILMGVRLSELTRRQKIIFFTCAVVLPAFNHVLRVHIGAETYSKLIHLSAVPLPDRLQPDQDALHDPHRAGIHNTYGHHR